MSSIFAISLATAAIGAVVILIARFRLNPFIVLFTVSILLALIAGMPADKVVGSFEAGAGHVLGHVGTVIALGTMLGKMLAESGGADRIALTISNVAGRRRVDWAMMLIGLLIGLPVFFEVGFVLLIPLAFVLAERTDTPLLRVALPMGAALSVTHALIPPHPAALLAVSAYHANIGRTILLGIVIGTPIAIIAGPLFGRFASARVIPVGVNPLAKQFVSSKPPTSLPGFGITVFTILSPVMLMLIGSVADRITTPHSGPSTVLHFIGNTDIALLLATILSFYVLGQARGFSRETILRFTNECLGPTALIMLLIGAGGGFGRVLVDSGVSKSITDAALGAHMPLLILAWMLAAIVRIACGSATVAMATASGIVAPILASSTGVSPELMVLVTGAGSVAFGPMNDAGFWQIKEYLGLTVPQTIKTWSALETLIAVCGLVFCLIASIFVH
ncbi:GntT/GntP/DsdX family permease [Gluconobacter wancherniae]|uniref:2-keto-3-deoxygluconate permease n=1 Tax=Gluconobacter wancherniae NBRC 103581 TaxID=656744 RepID=A0A511AY25_9PROT|nr:gluconate:H+ symporter [Gluconobacter wancherniae]MBF0853277.1 permease DsdX [Gluconobacter wancherniae]MBS1061461.1 permease DsdX [Gluconobacter wancherniae]MBS1093773.1 permease DsdX [Gluconobacter wancherniae]GBD55992.1 2-keto-3-deoxygluconate permease [Gluconobacter wancherniae NBRC 103581]GBR62988.1 gluconate permease [Gluconobacter wancherniae NBRC 103581]